MTYTSTISMETIFLSLGSNLGDRFAMISKAHDMLFKEKQIIQDINASHLYETEPWGIKDRPWYLNSMVTGKTNLSPEELLQAIQEIETILGRDRQTEKTNSDSDPYPPRPIDIDILFYGYRVVNTPELTIPHPHIEHRRFVLQPLAELAPKFLHPVLKKTVWELLRECKDKSKTKPYEPART